MVQISETLNPAFSSAHYEEQTCQLKTRELLRISQVLTDIKDKFNLGYQ